jgi:hypothetical protein
LKPAPDAVVVCPYKIVLSNKAGAVTDSDAVPVAVDTTAVEASPATVKDDEAACAW